MVRAFMRGFRRGLVQGGGIGSVIGLPMVLWHAPPLMAFVVVAMVAMVAMCAFEMGERRR